jgi:hypothetical protein
MEFEVEFYETMSGHCPVRDFLEELKRTDVLRGMAKLRNRQYHGEPLSKALGEGLYELRHVGKLNTRLLWFFVKGRRIIRRAWHPQQRPGHCGPRHRNCRGRMRDWQERFEK